jgi:hypothetical protein
MTLNVPNLARAVVSWLEFETLCGRERLLPEASMAQPIGAFLLAHSDHDLLPEEPHPSLPKVKHPPQLDFGIRRPDKSFSLALETKWVNDKREIKQELLDDLLRLELVHTQDRQVDRLLLVAGIKRHLDKRIFSARLGKGVNATPFADGILPNAIGPWATVELGSSVGAHRKLWKKAPHLTVAGPAAPNVKVAQWPLRFKVRLEAVYPAAPLPEDIACYVWGVGRGKKRGPL